ncbi:MAG: polyphosphate kinase 1 [Ginsengibacter sp.]
MEQDHHYSLFNMMLLNRDLSWLSFNLRVLQEAANPVVPLYERLKFMAIFSSNLNEFFRVRYPEVIALSILNKKIKKAIDNFDENIAEKVQDEIKRQLNYFGEILHNQILPALKDNGIIFYYDMPIREEHLHEIREIFLSNVLSFIQPLYLDGKSEKGFLPENNHLYFVITLQENFDGILKQAIVNIPSEKIKRFFTLTPLDDHQYVIFLDDIVRENLIYLFPGQNILGVYSIKINRDAELHLEDEYSGNLLQKIEKQLKKRDFGPPSRFLYEEGMPRNLQMFLEAAFNITSEEMFSGGRYHNLDDLADFPSFNKDLFYEKRKPLSSSNVMNSGDIFKILIKDDILLHVPYQSYNPVLSFFNQAAVDVNVTDIYITLYRVAQESHIINALISAAKNGKNVVAFIELKARFDEANNIKWSKVMKQAGVKIIYSIPQIKVHSKIALVQKRKGDTKQSFAILSTGNFNEVTAQFYADHVLMTTDELITKELLQLFNFLELRNEVDNSKKLKFDALLVSQFNMISELEKLINKEIAKAKKGEPAMIRIKVNSLEEPGFIELLYKAGKAGVIIHLLVRGISCIVADIPGKSENISVKRIIDRYLEHSRIMIFGTDENADLIIGSSDLMTRNLFHRIEVSVRIKNQNCKNELIHYFNLQWRDNDKSVWLLAGFQQKQPKKTGSEKLNAQSMIYNYLATKK